MQDKPNEFFACFQGISSMTCEKNSTLNGSATVSVGAEHGRLHQLGINEADLCLTNYLDRVQYYFLKQSRGMGVQFDRVFGEFGDDVWLIKAAIPAASPSQSKQFDGIASVTVALPKIFTCYDKASGRLQAGVTALILKSKLMQSCAGPA